MKICKECEKEFDEINNFSAKMSVGEEIHFFCSLECLTKWMTKIIKDLPTCKKFDCKHQSSIPGDCHIRCKHPLVSEEDSAIDADILSLLSGRVKFHYASSLARKMGVSGHITGIKNGWFNWPYNFDPIWLESCAKFEKRE